MRSYEQAAAQLPAHGTSFVALDKEDAVSSRLQTSVDSLSISDGVWQEMASNVGISEQSSIIPTKHGRGSVYVLVETIGSFPDLAKIEQEIIRIIEEHCRTPGSITAGIRAAVKAANSYLFEENLNAPREDRGVAGVTTVVLKDRDAFVGQCGPAVLYHVGSLQSKRLPQESTWLTSATLQDVDVAKQPPLGLRREIEPQLSHLQVEEGQVLILASTSLAKLVDDEQLLTATARRGEHAIRGHLESLAQGQDFSVLIIEILPVDQGLEALEPAVPAPAIAQPRGSLWARTSSALRERFFPSQADREELEEDWEEPASPHLLEEEVEEERLLPSVDWRAALQSVGRTFSRVGQGLGTLLVRVLPETDSRQRTRQPKGKVRGRAGEDAHRRGAKESAQAERRWLWAVFLIPLIVVLLFALTRFQYGRARQAQFQELVTGFEDAIAAAEASAAVAEQRAKLTEALAFVTDALAMKPGDEELQSQQKAVQEWLDRVNRLSRIFYFSELQEFADTESAPSQSRRVLVQEIDVYVLDSGTDRVYKYLLNDQRDGLQILPGDAVLLRKGDQHGETTVDPLLDMAWVEAGGLRGMSNLLVVDQQGQVLLYDPSLGLSEFPPADGSTWGQPVAAAGYYGRLYLLDRQTNQILRYTLTNSGYEGTPSSYIQDETAPDLSDALDLAIDGNVYVLHSSGMISKYEEGVAALFPQTDLDRPLSSPSSIFATGFLEEDGYVYVADAGNERIVQFSKTGDFVRQFQDRDATHMDDLKSIFVEEGDKKLFFLNGNKLFLAHLPE
jgi:hypothetical protein